MWFEYNFKRYKVWSYSYFGQDGTGGHHTAIKIIKNKKGKDYKGQIFAQECSWKHRQEISGLDLDIIKLKCMVIAKDLGWNIRVIDLKTRS